MTAPNPPNQLNTEIRNRLDKELRNKQFSRSDFHDLADKLGKERKCISSSLNKFHHYGLLKMIASKRTGHGGGDVKTYRVVKGASFVLKNSGTIKKEACERLRSKEEKAARACRRLVKAMGGFVQISY